MSNDGICGSDPSGFGPGNDDGTDLAPCFQTLLFGIPPFVMAVFFGGARLIQLRNQTQSDIDVPALRSHRIRMISSLTLVGLPVLFMLCLAAISSNSFWTSYPYVVFGLGIQAISWAINSLTLESEYRKGRVSNWMLRSFWIVSFISATKFLQSEILRAITDEVHALIISSSLLYICQIVMLYYGIRGIEVIPSIYDDPLLQKSAYSAPYGSSKLNLQKNSDVANQDKIWGDWLEYGMSGDKEQGDDDDQNEKEYVPGGDEEEIEFTDKLFAYVKVPSWAEIEVEDSDERVVQYSIHVGTVSDASWTTSRKFKDFEALHERLMKIGTDRNVSLPPLLTMQNLDSQRLHLQKYLQFAIDQDEFSNELANFLAYRDNIHRHSSGGTTTTGTSSTAFTRSSGVVSLHSIHNDTIESTESDDPNSKRTVIGKVRKPTDDRELYLLGVSVKKWSKWLDEDSSGSNIVTYDLNINTKFGEWIVRKSYDQIRDLHVHMETEYGDMLPEVPRRTFVGDQSRDFLNKRKIELETYLQSLIMTDVFQCEDLFDFFELTKHSNWKRKTPQPNKICFTDVLKDKYSKESSPKSSSGGGSGGGKDNINTSGNASANGNQKDTANLMSGNGDRQGSPTSDENRMDDDLKDEFGDEERPPMVHRKSTVVLSDDSDSSDDESIISRQSLPRALPGGLTEDEYDMPDGRTPVDASSDLSGKTPNPMVHRFRAVLSKWTLSDPHDARSSYIEYWIDVREYISVSNYIGWQVKHRYRDFLKLRKQLKKKFPKKSIPKVPPKGVYASSPHSEIDKRATQLEVFLQKLINTSVFQCNDLFGFLDLNNPNRKIEFGSHLDET